MKFLSKNLAENRKEKLFLNDPSFCKCQNQYYPYNSNLIKFCRHTFFFLITHFFVIFVKEKVFSSKIHRDEIKNAFQDI